MGRVMAYTPFVLSRRPGHTFVLMHDSACPLEFLLRGPGPDWEALDFVEFLETKANQTTQKRRLFWLIFAAMS